MGLSHGDTLIYVTSAGRMVNSAHSDQNDPSGILSAQLNTGFHGGDGLIGVYKVDHD